MWHIRVGGLKTVEVQSRMRADADSYPCAKRDLSTQEFAPFHYENVSRDLEKACAGLRLRAIICIASNIEFVRGHKCNTVFRVVLECKTSNHLQVELIIFVQASEITVPNEILGCI